MRERERERERALSAIIEWTMHDYLTPHAITIMMIKYPKLSRLDIEMMKVLHLHCLGKESMSIGAIATKKSRVYKSRHYAEWHTCRLGEFHCIVPIPVCAKSRAAGTVSVQWTGLLDWITGLDYCTHTSILHGLYTIDCASWKNKSQVLIET